MVIQHNLTSMNSNRQLGITTGVRAKSAEKLSSGYKVNRAADDAAGLAISEKMRRQIRGLSQAEDNVQDGISYVQVADAALAEIDDILNRINELCIKAATETLTPEDREYIDQEIQQLKRESNRTFGTTTFNEKPIWDEHTTDRKQIGTEPRPIFTWKQGTSEYPGTLNETNKGAWPANGQFRFEATSEKVKIKWTGYDGVNYLSNEIPMPSLEELRENGLNLSLNASTMNYSTYPGAKDMNLKASLVLDSDATIEQLVTQLNNTGITASISYHDVGGTVISTTTNPRIYVYDGYMSYLGGLISGRDVTASRDTDHIVGASDNKSPSGALTSTMSFSFSMTKDADTVPKNGTFAVTATTGNSVSTRAYDFRKETEDLWWEYDDDDGSRDLIYHTFTGNDLKEAIDNALNINNDDCIIDDSDTGGDLFITFYLSPNSAVSYSNGNGSEGSKLNNNFGWFELRVDVQHGESAANVMDRIKSITGVDLYTDDAPNVTLRNWGIPDYDAPVYGGTMALNIQAGSEGNEDNLIPIVYDVLNNHSLRINDLNALTVDNAKKGIEQSKNAKSIVDEQRAVFGAYQNRMEHTYKNLGNVVENTQHAESLIRDTDMAAEMVRFSNENILAQAGQSMLAQANQTNQGVLSLLQ
jgi:flagellin